ncbi:MAG: phosphatase PAP2 family protein [Actinomycetia bacterium]|nr:phosphatase PAP2 family protein [Actinomycetes bacterium]
MLPLIAAALLFFATLTTLVELSPRVRAWDESIAQWAADDASPWATDLARWATHLADTNVYVALTTVVIVALLVARRSRLAGFVASVAIGQWILSNSIKHLVGRGRPQVYRLIAAAGSSFPSGHATAAASLYLALALVAAALWPRLSQVALIAAAIAIAIVVAASRVLVGVHWTTDVLAGLALGWAWCLLLAWVFRMPVLITASTETAMVQK